MLLGVLFSSCFLSYQWSILFPGMLIPLSAAETVWLSLTCNLCYCYGITCNPLHGFWLIVLPDWGSFTTEYRYLKWFRKIVAILFYRSWNILRNSILSINKH